MNLQVLHSIYHCDYHESVKHSLHLVAAIVGCELVGVLGGVFTASAIPVWYMNLNKPVFSPPNWVFGPVWTLLYLLMGIAVYLVWIQKSTQKTKISLTFFIAQLIFNFLWSVLFFAMQSPLFALVDIIILWLLIVGTIIKFYPLSKIAAYLLVPYLVWVSFATILNASIVVLNP